MLLPISNQVPCDYEKFFYGSDAIMVNVKSPGDNVTLVSPEAVTSSLILSTRSCLPCSLSTSANFLYVAIDPNFPRHILSISKFCVWSGVGEIWVPTDTCTGNSSVSVSPRAGDINLKSTLNCDMYCKCWSEQGWSHNDSISVKPQKQKSTTIKHVHIHDHKPEKSRSF